MDAVLNPDQEKFAQRAQFLLKLNDARSALAAGAGRPITQESVRELAHEVKERGRARLLREMTTSG